MPQSADMDIDAFLEGGFEELSDACLLKASDAQQPVPAHPQESTAIAEMQVHIHNEQNFVEGKGKKKKKKKIDKAHKAAAVSPAAQHSNAAAQSVSQSDLKQPRKEETERSGPAAVQRELKSHREELEALKESDPSFYEYLQQSDKSLLDFDSDDDDDDGNQESEEEVPDQQGDAAASPSLSKGNAGKASTKPASQHDNAANDDDAQPRGTRPSCVVEAHVPIGWRDSRYIHVFIRTGHIVAMCPALCRNTLGQGDDASIE